MKRLFGLLLVFALVAAAQTTREITKAEEAQGFFVLTIASGASLSDQIRLSPKCPALRGIQMPGTWTTANLTALRSAGGTTYGPLYDMWGTQITITVPPVALAYIRLDLADWAGTKYLQLRSGTADTPVNQGGTRLITCECWR